MKCQNSARTPAEHRLQTQSANNGAAFRARVPTHLRISSPVNEAGGGGAWRGELDEHGMKNFRPGRNECAGSISSCCRTPKMLR